MLLLQFLLWKRPGSGSIPSPPAPSSNLSLQLAEQLAEQGRQLEAFQAQLQVLSDAQKSGSPGGSGSYQGLGLYPDADDTQLLDRLALGGGAIALEPRTYRRRGTWRLAKNGTYVRGWPGLTKLVVEAADPTTSFSGISISACPESGHEAADCVYSHQYSRDKPLSHVYIEGVAIELVQNQSLDADGHCCGAGSADNAAGGLAGSSGMYGLVVTNVAYGHAVDVSVSGAHFQGIGIVNSASFHLVRPVSTFCFSTDIAINDFSFDCSITDALVTADGWPTMTNWTGQFKDDALAVQGYTRANRIRGGTVRLGKVQSSGGAACVKLSGTSDVIVSDVFCEGHMNSLTIDYSQYIDHPHSEIIVSNLIGIDPVANGINLWGSGFPAAGVPPYSRISIISPILTQRRTTHPTRRGLAGAYLCYADGVVISNALITGFGVGVDLDSGPHATSYSLSYMGGHIRDVTTAFRVGNAVWSHSRISDVTVTNATTTASGPGLDEPIFGNIFEYDVNVTRTRPPPPPPPPSPSPPSLGHPIPPFPVSMEFSNAHI
eukprot:COSAG02_NODE_3155_length_7265_cov_6.553586_6_plen_546_part_00